MTASGVFVAAMLLASCAVDDSATTTMGSAAGQTCDVVGSVTKSERGTFYCTQVNDAEKVWKPYSAYKRYEIQEDINTVAPKLNEVAASDSLANERFLAAEQIMTDLAEQEPSLEGKMPSEYYGDRTRWCIDVMSAAIDYASAMPPGTLMPEIYFRCGGGSSDYENCSDARADGMDPLYRGERGYDDHLDRDSDGIGCEQ